MNNRSNNDAGSTGGDSTASSNASNNSSSSATPGNPGHVATIVEDDQQLYDWGIENRMDQYYQVKAVQWKKKFIFASQNNASCIT